MTANNPLPRQTLVIDWVFTGLGLLGLGLLVTGKHVNQKAIAGCDYLAILVWILGLGLVCQTTWAIKTEEQAEHQFDIPRSNLEKAAQSLMVNEALWTVANTGLRTSAWLFILEIFGPARRMRITVRVFIVVCLCHCVASLLEIFLVCRPVAANWESMIGGTCGNVLASYVFMESTGLLLDVVVLMVPPFSVFSLQMKSRQKWGIAAVFEVGWIVFVVTGLRLHALRLSISPDYTWSESYLGMLSAVGCMLGVLLCSVPAMISLFRKLEVIKTSVAFLKLLLEPFRKHISSDAIGPIVAPKTYSSSTQEQDDITNDVEALETKVVINRIS